MLGSIDLFMTIILVLLGIVLGVIIFWLIQEGRESRINSQLEANSKKEAAGIKNNANPAKVDYPTDDVQKFMEFDNIEDDMIIQEKGNRYVMALKCQGINYDLMSENEMLAVEEGFSNFLNTLKWPIQLYVQARSLNLEESINAYKERVYTLREDYDRAENNYTTALRTGNGNKAELELELKKKKVLLEYAADIVNYVDKMSMNRNILQRKYYIVVSYHTSELGMATNFTKEEAHDLAYSELYTRCRSIAGALAPCGVQTSIMDSMELAEMLYIAYNRDESDIYNIRKALDSGFYRLYSTSEDVIQKKRDAIDNKVKEQAIAEAERALQEAMDKLKDNNGLTEEEEREDSAKAQAMQIIIDNSDQFAQEVVDEALINLNSGMHVPILDQDEIDTIAEKRAQDEANGKVIDYNSTYQDDDEMYDDEDDDNQENVTDDVLNMINDVVDSNDEDLV